MLSVAMSIDALAVELGLSLLKVPVWISALTIGLITLFIWFLIVCIGYRFASFLELELSLWATQS
jgi:putative Mn2+ efflux pump MntP